MCAKCSRLGQPRSARRSSRRTAGPSSGGTGCRVMCLLSWWRWEESNLRHGAYETPALPLSYTAGPTRPKTSGPDFTPGSSRAPLARFGLDTEDVCYNPAEQTTRRSPHMQFRTHPWHQLVERSPADDEKDDEDEDDEEFDDDFDDDELDEGEVADDDAEELDELDDDETLDDDEEEADLLDEEDDADDEDEDTGSAPN